MISFTLKAIAPVLNAKLIGDDRNISTVTIDSRSSNINKNSLFIALKGNKFDAHNFAKTVVFNYGAALLVDHKLPFEVPQLIVSNTRRALGELAAWVRQQVSTKIIAITGSSGKTSVKEMTASILRQSGRVLATEANFNNDIGVSLTLLRLTSKYDFAVIELGASHFGEIAWTVNLVQPDIALVNNIAAAHLEGFKLISGVAQAKGEIFSGLPVNGRGIFNADSHSWPCWKHILGRKAVWRFALDNIKGADFFASDISINWHSTYFILHSPYGKHKIKLHLLGKHNIANALAASALALSVGVKPSTIIAGLAQIKPLPGRLFPIALSANHLLLDDSYNANVCSMEAAIQILTYTPGYRIIVVSDMLELGDSSVAYHRQAGKNIALSSIDKVLSIGNLGYLISKYSKKGEHFQNKETIITRLMQLISENETMTILVKGSRMFAMEQIVNALRKMCYVNLGI